MNIKTDYFTNTTTVIKARYNDCVLSLIYDEDDNEELHCQMGNFESKIDRRFFEMKEEFIGQNIKKLKMKLKRLSNIGENMNDDEKVKFFSIVGFLEGFEYDYEGPSEDIGIEYFS